MIFEGFKIHAVPHIDDAYCTNKRCKKKGRLEEVSNGFLSAALFCRECESVYLIKLERVKKVPKDFLQQCKDEIERKLRKAKASMLFDDEIEKRKKK